MKAKRLVKNPKTGIWPILLAALALSSCAGDTLIERGYSSSYDGNHESPGISIFSVYLDLKTRGKAHPGPSKNPSIFVYFGNPGWLRSLYETGNKDGQTLDSIRIEQPTVLRLVRYVFYRRPNGTNEVFDKIPIFESRATLYDHLLSEESLIESEAWSFEDSFTADDLPAKEGFFRYYAELYPQEEGAKVDLVISGEEFYGFKGDGCRFNFKVDWFGNVKLS